MEVPYLISEGFNRISGGKRAWAIVLALAVGALLPMLTVVQTAMLLPVMMIGGVFTVFLQCYAGWIPAALFMGAGLASTAWFAGTTVMWMLLLAAFLPAGAVVRGIAAKKPFFDQLRAAILLYAAGLLAALGVAYAAFGGNMVSRFMDTVRAEFARMPDAAFAPFLDTLNTALLLNGVQGMKMITVDVYRAQINGMLDLMQESYGQMLPGTMLCGVVLSGVASVLWGNWRMARRGMASDESFTGMSRWFLPSQVSVGALALWLAGYLISVSGYAKGATVYATVYQLVSCVFIIQAFAAIDRALIRGGRALRGRRILLGLLLVICAVFRTLGGMLFTVGLVSALFGSHGAIRQRMNNRDNSDRQDPEQ